VAVIFGIFEDITVGDGLRKGLRYGGAIFDYRRVMFKILPVRNFEKREQSSRTPHCNRRVREYFPVAFPKEVWNAPVGNPNGGLMKVVSL
jgi:hypothetical protein